MCSDLTSDAEKPLFWCPLGHANTVRSGDTRGRDPWTHGALQHRSACLLTAHRPVNGVREVREAAEQRADGAGHAHVAHAHRSAPHLVLRASLRALLRRCRGGHGGKNSSGYRGSSELKSGSMHAHEYRGCTEATHKQAHVPPSEEFEPPFRFFVSMQSYRTCQVPYAGLSRSIGNTSGLPRSAADHRRPTKT